jgi:hypothetical protein
MICPKNPVCHGYCLSEKVTGDIISGFIEENQFFGWVKSLPQQHLQMLLDFHIVPQDIVEDDDILNRSMRRSAGYQPKRRPQQTLVSNRCLGKLLSFIQEVMIFSFAQGLKKLTLFKLEGLAQLGGIFLCQKPVGPSCEVPREWHVI